MDVNDTLYCESTWEKERYIRRNFPVVADIPNVRVNYIHPLQQRNIAAIYDIIRTDFRIESVILFGSSVNLRCTIHSDLDLCVKLKEGYTGREVKNDVSEKIQMSCNWNADILWADTIEENDRIYHDIKTMGVKII